MNNDLLFELCIVGSDYTKIKECFSECYIRDCSLSRGRKPKEYIEFLRKIYCSEKINDKKYKFYGQETVKKRITKDKQDFIISILEKLKTLIDSIENKETIEKIEPLELEEIKGEFKRQRIKCRIENIIDGIKPDDVVPEVDKIDELFKDIDGIIDSYKDKDDIFNDINTIYEEFKTKRDYYSKKIDDLINDHPIILMFKKFSEEFELIENEKLIVGRRQDRINELKESECKLYDEFEATPKFGNLVGTVRKIYEIEVFKSFLIRAFSGVTYIETINSVFDKVCEKYSGKKIAITVLIHSRLDDNPEKPFFLLDMLTQGNLRFNSSEILSDDKNAAIFDCLMLWRLKKYLMTAYKKGAYRTYHTFDDNSMKIRGAIDFAKHIKLNAGLNNGKVAFTYREKSADNYLNHLILEAYEYLKTKYFSLVVQNFDNEFEVKEIINLLKQETNYPKYSRSMLMSKCESPISHPYYTEYEELRLICLSVLRNEGASLISGSGEKVSGILYYIPDLWEEYLESKMDDYSFRAQETISYFSSEKGYPNKIRPDYILMNENNEPFMILDAKYRPGWLDTHKNGSLGYYKEDFRECIVNMNAIDAYATGVIFPCKKEEGNDVETINLHTISEYNKLSSFYTIPICVPDVNDSEKTIEDEFNLWQDKLLAELNNKINCLKIIIDAEKKKNDLIKKAIGTVDKEKVAEYYNKRKENCTILTPS